MKKEQEILLDPEEIQQLLEGGLYWNDIQPKLSPENIDAIKRQLNLDEDLEIDQIKRSTTIEEECDDEKDVREILLGEDKAQSRTNDSPDKGFEPVIKNRQINLSQMEAAITEETLSEESLSDKTLLKGTLPEDMQEEENLIRRKLFGTDSDEEAEVSCEEKNRFFHLNERSADETGTGEDRSSKVFADNELKDMILNDEIEVEEEHTSFGGLKVILLLVVVAFLTFGFWYYFINS